MENILYYKNEADFFEEALPVGNGRLGAMIYGKTGCEKISLNDDTLWTGTGKRNPVPENAQEAYKKARELVLNDKISEAQEEIAANFHSMWSQVYMPVGNLMIDFGHGNVNNYLRTLDFSTGICRVSYNSDGVEYEREVFASYPDDVIVIRMCSSKKGALNFSLRAQTELKVLSENIEDNIYALVGQSPSNGCIYPTVQKEPVVYTEKNGMGFTLAIKTETDGCLSEDNGALRVRNATVAVVYVSIKTSFNGFDKDPDKEGLNHYENALGVLNRLASDTYDRVKETHKNDFSSLYNRVCFDLKSTGTDEDIVSRLQKFNGSDLGLYELLFGYGRYLTISASRPGTQATNLQGIWNEQIKPPWSSNYTININTQMNYWPTLNTNLAECFEPFVALAKRLRKSGTQTARDYYGVRGFVSHHNTDLWAMTNPVGITRGGFSCVYAFWNMSSGWIGCQLFDLYEYTLDKKLLEDVYPVIRDASLFYCDIIFKDEEGYTVCPSTSPENMYTRGDDSKLSVSKTTTMTVSILRELFTRFLKASEILGISDEITARVSEIFAELYPLKTGSDGRMLEWAHEEVESEVRHRHVSHLYSLYPGNQISFERTPELAQACKKSLLVRGDDGTGWCISWKASLWAYLRDGNHALSLLKNQLRLVDASETVNYSGGGGTYPNMMDAHPPFQIDGNYGSTAAICNMLMQSEPGHITLLPALPDEWSDGSVSGIVAKGNVEISMEWKNKEVVSLILKSPYDCVVDVNFNNQSKQITLNSGAVCRVI